MSAQGPLTVRPREPADMAALGQVLVRVHRVDGYPVEGVAEPEAWLQPEREMAAWTVAMDGHPIGHISLTSADPQDDAVRVWIGHANGALDGIAVVTRLYLDPDYRGHGAGQELMRTAYQHAVELGKRLVFDVMLKDRQAVRLYEALGCERLGVITHRHGVGLEEPGAVYAAPDHMPARRA